MLRTIPSAVLCCLFLLTQVYGQDVFVPRELRATAVKQPEKEQPAQIEKAPPASPSTASTHSEKGQLPKTEPESAPAMKPSAVSAHSDKVKSVKAEPGKVKEPVAKARSEKVQSAKAEPDKAKPPAVKELSGKSPSEEIRSVRAGPVEPEAKRKSINPEPAKASVAKESATNPPSEKIKLGRGGAVSSLAVKDPPANLSSEKVQPVKTEPVKERVAKEVAVDSSAEKKSIKAESAKALAAKESPANPRSEKIQSAKVEPVKTPAVKEPPANLQSEKIQTVKADPGKLPAQEPTVDVQLLNRSMETGSTRLADGFDFPVGKPEAEGYYRARGFRSGGHMGEDWDGVRGGDTDLKDPIYCIGDGIVVFARDVHRGWGNVIIVRHAFRESGRVKHVDSLYGHLNSILVSRGQRVTRGQQIGTMGTAHGQYDAHLHLEIRKNLEIGMSRAKFQKNLSNYYDPSQFIASHRRLSGGGANFRVAMNTFTHDSAYHFDDAPNFSARKQSTAQSSAALKQAISSTTR